MPSKEEAREKYYIGGLPASKEDYLDAGGVPVPAPPLQSPLIPMGQRYAEIFEDGGKTTFFVQGQEVTREYFLATIRARLVADLGPSEVKDTEKKAFANIKNYLHNTLGLTKSHVQGMLQGMMQETLLDLVRQELGLSPMKPALGSRLTYAPSISEVEQSRPFADVVRRIVVEELQKLAKISTLNTYVEKICQEEIRRHVLARLKVDIRVQSVNPQDGVESEMVSPDYREAREV